MTAIVTRGNAAELHLPDESVDLIVTSPPYFGLRSYQDGGEHYAGQVGDEATPAEYLDALITCTREWMRVLKPGGSIFVNLGDKYGPDKSLMWLPQRYAIRCVDELGLIARAEIVWAKSNGLPESIRDRVRRSHEHVFHLTKGAHYFASLDDIREQYTGDRALSRRIKRPGEGKHAQRAPWESENPAGRLPTSVWTIATSPLRVPQELGIDHLAPYPPELVRRIVLGWSPSGGVVLDPFAGTGTTMLVASVHGRVGIGVDLSADYCRLAEWRVKDPKQRARAAGAKRPSRGKAEMAEVIEMPGQASLFGEASA